MENVDCEAKKENSIKQQEKVFNDAKITIWKIWKINNSTNHDIQLLCADPPQALGLNLQGANGYNNGVKILNDACDKLYSNTEKGITARSFDAKDVEDAMVDNGKNVQTVAKALDSNYGTTYVLQNDNIPTVYGTATTIDIRTSQNNDSRPQDKSLITTGAIKRTKATLKYSGYNISQQDMATYIGKTRANILGTRTCWLASRVVTVATQNGNDTYAGMFIEVLASGEFGRGGLYSSHGVDYKTRTGLCPTIDLGASVQLNSTSANTWSVK